MEDGERWAERFAKSVGLTNYSWVSYSYINGDPSPANALIKKDNPEMTDELLAYSLKTMKEMGIVDSGESKENGIGAMNEARWKRFADFAVSVGIYPAGFDWKSAFTTEFVNKKVGMAK